MASKRSPTPAILCFVGHILPGFSRSLQLASPTGFPSSGDWKSCDSNWRGRMVPTQDHPTHLCSLDDRGLPDWVDGFPINLGHLVLWCIHATRFDFPAPAPRCAGPESPTRNGFLLGFKRSRRRSAALLATVLVSGRCNSATRFAPVRSP